MSKFRFKRDKKWDALLKSLETKSAKTILERHVQRATKLNGFMLERFIRENIERGSFEANRPLTLALKGGGKPLVGYEAGAQLYNSITHQLVGPTSVFVGVIKTNEFYDIAKTLHDGAVIPVTPSMRGMFFALWQVSIGALPSSQLSPNAQRLFNQMSTGWKPLKASTQAIVIPPRPYIDDAFQNPAAYKIAQDNWRVALKTAMAEITGAVR